MAISTASTADPPVFSTFMASRAALRYVSEAKPRRGIFLLVAGGEMYHLIGYAVVSSSGMDEDAGRVAKLPASFVREHREIESG